MAWFYIVWENVAVMVFGGKVKETLYFSSGRRNSAPLKLRIVLSYNG